MIKRCIHGSRWLADKRASMVLAESRDLFFGTEKPQTGKVAAPQQGGKSSRRHIVHPSLSKMFHVKYFDCTQQRLADR